MSVNPGFFISKLLRLINRPALRNCHIDRTAKVGTGSNCINVSMGKYSYMGKNNSVSNCDIGAFCSIASYCAIGGGAHRMDCVSTSPVFTEGKNVFGVNFGFQEQPQQKKVKIGNDVWIGEGAFIVDGIKIGDGAVIGAHSVVTHNVEPYAVVAGSPARVLRYRFQEDEIKKLLESKWWEWSADKLKQNGASFCSINEFKNI